MRMCDSAENGSLNTNNGTIKSSSVFFVSNKTPLLQTTVASVPLEKYNAVAFSNGEKLVRSSLKKEINRNMTGSEINHSFLFHGVLKILTACGMLRISIARCQIEAEIHSFPTMYIMGGGRYVRNGSNR